jgi:hypothetical protein
MSDETPLSESAPGSSGFISPLLALIGTGVLIACVFYAIVNHNLLKYYSATTEANYVQYNIIRDASNKRQTAQWTFTYDYQLGDKTYTTFLESSRFPGHTISIHYNPQNPVENYAEQIMPPMWCLIIGVIVGGVFLFFGYVFRI